MPTHRQFKELCALSTSGDLSREERNHLRVHLTECDECRIFLGETRSVSDSLVPSTPVFPETAAPIGMRERFLARAQSEGLRIEAGSPVDLPASTEPQSQYAPPKEQHISPIGLATRSWPVWTLLGGACAACLVLGVILRTPLERKWPSVFGKTTATRVALHLASPTLPLGNPDHDKLVALTRERDELGRQITALGRERDDLEKQKQESEQHLTAKLASTESNATEDHDALTRQTQELSTRAADLESQLNKLRQQQSLLEADLHTERTRAAEYAARLELAQKAIRLETSAAPTPALASASEPNDAEIGSLVASRNLHIIDVYDSNAAGNRQRAFGRVFYVEGRSLVFYAFDLSGPKEAKNITFHLWGEKAGQKETTLSLGVLHDDDPAERRWALTFDDPKVLAKINSVYVTAESKPGDQPRGPKVLYAYFGAQPNHP